jgi:hypothetical protein
MAQGKPAGPSAPCGGCGGFRIAAGDAAARRPFRLPGRQLDRPKPASWEAGCLLGGMKVNLKLHAVIRLYGCGAWLAGLLEQGSACRFGTAAAAGSELLISEPKTQVDAPASSVTGCDHPVSSTRDQQAQTGSGRQLNQSIHVKSTVGSVHVAQHHCSHCRCDEYLPLLVIAIHNPGCRARQVHSGSRVEPSAAATEGGGSRKRKDRY